jgi:hypothetical protein
MAASPRTPVVFIHGDSLAITELRRFEGRGHSLVVDSGWREVADACLSWLREREL